jgi:hypothetical protein
MSKYHDEKYDEMKSMLNTLRSLNEQVSIQRDNVAQSIEDKINQDNDEERQCHRSQIDIR